MKHRRTETIDKSLLSLKKSPTQERAKNLVNSILEATIRLLSRDASPLISTTDIAEKAGVSVGSLYEYFPGKEAIFAKLVELDLQRNETKLRETIQTLQGQSASAKIRALAEFGVDQFLSGAEFKRRLFQNVYQLQKVRDVLAAWNGIAAIFSELMRAHATELKITEDRIDLAAYVISNSVQGLLQTYLLSGHERFSKEKLKREIVELLEGYLLAASR